MAKVIKQKEIVKIRKRKLKDGNYSLYLDIYCNGQREREFLKLYLIPELKPADKKKNIVTLALAEKRKNERAEQLIKNSFNVTKTVAQNESRKVMVSDCLEYKYRYATHLAKNTLLATKDVRAVILREGWDCRIDKLPRNYLIDIVEKAKKIGKKPNTYSNYVGHISSSMKMYCKDYGLDMPILDKPTIKIHKTKTKFFLNEQEVAVLDDLWENPEKFKDIKLTPRCFRPKLSAFLFGIFVGIRMSDILSMKYEDIYVDDRGIYWLNVVQQKTENLVSLPVPERALKYIDYYPDKKGIIFDLNKRTLSYGIKEIGMRLFNFPMSMHKARHTYAMMLLKSGSEVYTVSKLLGHTTLSATQFYVDALDEEKVKAVRNLTNLLDGK